MNLLILSTMFSVALPISAAEHPAPADGESQKPDQVQPATKRDSQSPSTRDIPQPPQYLPKITRLEKGDNDGIIWGETQQGLAIGFGKIQTSLKSPMRPIVELYLENRGKETLEQEFFKRAQFELKWNDKNHDLSTLAHELRMNIRLEPGKRHGPVHLTTDQLAIWEMIQYGPIAIQRRAGPELTEGIHALRVVFQIEGPGEPAEPVANCGTRIQVMFAPYPVDEAVEMIRQGLNDKDPDVRRNTVMAAGYLKLSGCRDLLFEALQNEDEQIRKYACTSLGDLKDPMAIEPLRKRLEDQAMAVRLEAARSLIDLGLSLDRNWLEPIIKSKLTNEFQGAIMLARDQLKKQAVPLLIRCLEFEDPSANNYYNSILVQQIGECGGPKYKYQRNRESKGTRKQIQDNQRVLLELKAMVIEDL